MILLINSSLFIYDRDFFDNLLRNYTTIGYIYDLGSFGLLFTILVTCTIFPKFARRFSWILYMILCLAVWYLSCFFLNYAHKPRFNFHDWILSLYMAIFCSSLGLLVNVLVTGRKKLNDVVGITVSWVSYLVYEGLNYYVFTICSRHLWKLILMIIV